MTTRTTTKKRAPKDGSTAQKAPLRGPAIPAPRKPRNLDALLPGEQHPGQTSTQGRLHDRAGSQPEQERHRHPGSTTPKRGAARSNKRATKR
jgi:hypothetical protein